LMARADPRSALGFLKVAELQQLCKEQGLKPKGSKSELLERLVQHREHRAKAAAAKSSPRAAEPQGSQGTSAPSTATAVRNSTPQRTARGSCATPPVNGAALVERSPASSGRGSAGRGRGGRGRGRPPMHKAVAVCGTVPVTAASRALVCKSCRGRWELGQRHYTQKGDCLCPLCRLRLMDPFNKVVEPSGILHYVLVERPNVDFKLDLQELKQWRKTGLSVEIRMVKIDCDKLHQAWPNSLKFFVNGTESFSIQPPEDGHKRRDVPMTVSPSLKHGSNPIGFFIEDSVVSNFALAVVQTKPVSSSELASRVARCDRGAAKSRVCASLARQQNRQKGNSDDIVCMSSDKLCLRCPITMERIKDPVRGIQCQHLQCFSLDAYLQSNRQMRAFNNRWKCPVCTLILRPDDLTFDPYVDEVLAATSEEVDEVVVSVDGSWRVSSRDLKDDPDSPDCPQSRRQEAVDLDAFSPVRPEVVSEAATPQAAPSMGLRRESSSTPLSPAQKRLRLNPSSESTAESSAARVGKAVARTVNITPSRESLKPVAAMGQAQSARLATTSIDLEVVSDPE